jgi:hypothetical protein
VEREIEGICQIVYWIELFESIFLTVRTIENRRSTEGKAESAGVERHGLVRQEIDCLALKPPADCAQVTVAGEGPDRLLEILSSCFVTVAAIATSTPSAAYVHCTALQLLRQEAIPSSSTR